MRVLWTGPAAATFHALRVSEQREIGHRVRLLSSFPEMYPVRARQPYAGFRYCFVKHWCVSYVIAEDVVVILALFPARSG